MSLEALVRITEPPKGSFKKKGDIVCVKLSPAIWGEKEKKEFLIIKLEDAELEQKLINMKNAGEPHPVIPNPYSEVTPKEDGGIEVVKRSTKILDFSIIPKETLDIITDKTKDSPIFEKETYTLKNI